MAKDKDLIWSINRWYGGYSDDRYMGNDTNFFRGYNIAVRENPKFVTPVRQSLDRFAIPSGNAKKLLTLTTGDILTFTDNGDAFVNQNPVAVVTGLGNVVNAIEFTDQVVVIDSNGGVNYFDKISFGVITNVPYTTPVTGTDDCIPMLNVYDSNIYFGFNDKLYKVDNTLVTIDTAITLRMGEEINGLTFYQENVKIYTNYGGVDGYQYVWNQIGNLPQYSSKWEGTPIQYAMQNGATDLVVAGISTEYSQIYFVSGIQKKLFTRNDPDVISESRKGIIINCNAFGIRDDIYFLPGQTNIDTSTVTFPFGLFTIGSFYSNYPTCMNFEYDTGTDAPKAICFSAQDLYHVNTDNVVRRVQLGYYGASTYAQNGAFETNVFYAGSQFLKKKIKELQIGCGTLGNTGLGTIRIYGKFDGGAPVLMQTITSIAPTGQRFFFQSFTTPVPEWYQMQYLVEIDNVFPYGDSVQIFEMNTLYEIVKN